MGLPDVEALVIAHLKQDARLAGLVAGRVYSQLPATKVWPAVRIVRFGGAPAVAYPLVLDEARLQLDAFATSKGAVFDVVDAARDALANLPGSHPRGFVTGVDVGGLQYLPDADFDPALPRFILDATVWVKTNTTR